MAPVALSLLLAKDKFWDPLDRHERKNLVLWLRSIESCLDLKNNWIFFRVLVHLALRRLGEAYHHEQHVLDLEAIDLLYLGDGWYSDGPAPQLDYYIPMAMHFYGLIYSVFGHEIDPERCRKYKARAAEFAPKYIHWFSGDGASVPFGRSLIYRFAHASFWSAMMFADVQVQGISLGQMKGLALRNFRWWMGQDIFETNGVLSLGYVFKNHLVTERYNGPGSPYWALKFMLILAIPEGHPVWVVQEEPMPTRDNLSVQSQPGFIIQHDSISDNTTILSSGQYADFMYSSSPNKYAKFAYSTAFGFSVLGTDEGAGGAGHDNVLSLTDDDVHFRARGRCSLVSVADGCIYSRWHPWPDVMVDTWLAPYGIGHIRIHKITSLKQVKVVEGGFSLPTSFKFVRDKFGSDHSILIDDFGQSSMRDLTGMMVPGQENMRPNVNVLHPRCRMPTLTRDIQPGVSWLVSAVCAVTSRHASFDVHQWWEPLSWREDGVPSVYSSENLVVTARVM